MSQRHLDTLNSASIRPNNGITPISVPPVGRTPNPREKPMYSGGNVAEIISIINTDGKGANTSAQVGLEWMRGLRDRGPKVDKNSVSNESVRKSNGLDSDKKDREYNVPRVYQIQNPRQLRKNIKEYDYKGNFQDIQHLTKRPDHGGGTTELCQAKFAA